MKKYLVYLLIAALAVSGCSTTLEYKWEKGPESRTRTVKEYRITLNSEIEKKRAVAVGMLEREEKEQREMREVKREKRKYVPYNFGLDIFEFVAIPFFIFLGIPSLLNVGDYTTRVYQAPELALPLITVQDSPQGLTSGNGDGTIQNGETVEFLVKVQNKGLGTAYQAVLELVEVPEGIEIQEKSQSLGELLPSMTRTAKVRIKVPRSYSRSQIPLKFRVSEVRGAANRERIFLAPFQSTRPDLDFYVQFENPDGKGLHNGSKGVAQVTLRNYGNSTTIWATATRSREASGAFSLTSPDWKTPALPILFMMGT